MELHQRRPFARFRPVAAINAEPIDGAPEKSDGAAVEPPSKMPGSRLKRVATAYGCSLSLDLRRGAILYE
jgi:hypothetical protein